MNIWGDICVILGAVLVILGLCGVPSKIIMKCCVWRDKSKENKIQKI